jgi:hypothetical protein
MIAHTCDAWCTHPVNVVPYPCTCGMRERFGPLAMHTSDCESRKGNIPAPTPQTEATAAMVWGPR